MNGADVLLERRRGRHEVDQRLRAVEGVLADHLHAVAVEAHDVVAGLGVTAQALRTARAGVDHEQALEAPGVGHVLVPAQDEIDAALLQHLEQIAGVVDDLSLIHISEPTRRTPISYAVFCLKKKKKKIYDKQNRTRE